jgi:hypothetical protein
MLNTQQEKTQKTETECLMTSYTAQQLLRQKMKRKHANDDPEEPMSLCVNNSVLPVGRFMAPLANRASDGNLNCCTRIDGLNAFHLASFHLATLNFAEEMLPFPQLLTAAAT